MKKLNFFKALLPVICVFLIAAWISTPLLSVEKNEPTMSLRQLLKTMTPMQRAQFQQIVKDQFQCPGSEAQTDALTRMETILRNLEGILTADQLKAYRALADQSQKANKVVVITPPVPNCFSCYAAKSDVNAAITDLEDANYVYYMADYSTYCTSPPYGIPDPIRGSIDLAISYGEDAVDNFTTASSTCSCSAAQQALEDLEDAITFAEGAIEITNIYCISSAPWLDELAAALQHLQDALSDAQNCVTQACGASS